jgi:aminoglycoside phosphotransferase
MNYLFLLDKNQAEKFLSDKSEQIFGHKEIIKLLAVKRDKTFNEEESLNALYEFKFGGNLIKLRASTSNFLNKEHDFNVMNYFYQNGFNNPPFLVPEPVAYLKAEKILFYKDIEGQTLSDAISQKGSLEDFVKNCAQIARKIHLLQAPSFPLFEPTLLFQDFKYQLVASKFPKAKNLGKIVEIIKSSLSDGDKVLCHGDFNPNNILVNKNIVGLIDFAQTTIYYKEIDLASFLTHLRQQLRGNQTYFEKIRQIFLSSYGDYNKKTLGLLMAFIDSRLLEISVRFKTSNYDPGFIFECLNSDLAKVNIKLSNGT